MGKFEIQYGLGGGFGGAGEWEDCDADTLEEAEEIAWEMACQDYEQYDGLHGLRTVEDILEEGDAEDEEEAIEIWKEYREGWLDYAAREKAK